MVIYCAISNKGSKISLKTTGQIQRILTL